MVDKLVSSLQIDLGGCPRFIISTIITDRDLQMLPSLHLATAPRSSALHCAFHRLVGWCVVWWLA